MNKNEIKCVWANDAAQKVANKLLEFVTVQVKVEAAPLPLVMLLGPSDGTLKQLVAPEK